MFLRKMKRYNTLNDYLKKRFKGKIAKVCIDGGFSCPNRENSKTGCLFCTEEGAGEFTGNRLKSITIQIEEQKRIITSKWKADGYIAFFQNFTNTYAAEDTLRIKYEEALNCEGVVGLAIATRPDCLNEGIMKLLSELNKRTFLWIELGFQTSNENTSLLINRGYENKIFESAVNTLSELDILTVVHLIAGLPGESKQDFMNSIKYISKFKIWGVKLHSLYIQSNSPMKKYHEIHQFNLLTLNTYIEYVCDALEKLSPDMVVHRLTGDGKKELLIGPVWSLNKLKVLSSIDQEMIRRDSYQGKYHQR
ncbi:MAG: TIGR01212 family radical SAM protein [Clostridia bacterium]|nr:TIGR01212 family radical SAM protein [Clostridia bacterium]